MAYREELAEHLRDLMSRRTDIGSAEIVEKKMFGGLSFLVNGNMSAGVIADDFVFRVDPETTDEVLAKPFARRMDFTGRSMRGFAYVSADVLEVDEELSDWMDRSVGYALSLKPKKKKPPRSSKKK